MDCGLSPRVRGSRNDAISIAHINRSIPASAGQPQPPCLQAGRPQVYPRECGAAVLPAFNAEYADGLSPRVRGSPSVILRHVPRIGSIPASAGQPARTSSSRRTCKVYPRECGAAVMIYTCSTPVQGLSPRVRGSPRIRRRLIRWARSIPASAGQPIEGKNMSSKRKVYPRECGAAHHYCASNE